MTFTTITNEHFITLGVTFAVPMTVICPGLYFVDSVSTFTCCQHCCFYIGQKKKSNKLRREEHICVELLWLISHDTMNIQFEIQQSDNHKDLLFLSHKGFFSDEACKEFLYLEMSLAKPSDEDN